MLPYVSARPRTTSYLFAAAVVTLLIVPLVADTPAPRGPGAAAPGPIADMTAASAPLAFVSKRMTGTFVCVQCEGRQDTGLSPLPERVHVPGFCADNGEIWRLMTRDARFGDAALGRTATLEGTAFPQSGFLRANRVGY
jgi:hypothetical protein